MTPFVRKVSLALAIQLAFPLAALAARDNIGPDQSMAPLAYQPKVLAWEPKFAYRNVSLRVVGPYGYHHDQQFGTGKPTFDLSAQPALADGQYTYELNFRRQSDVALAQAMASAEYEEDGSLADPALRSRMAALRATVSGSFRVEGGKFVSPYLVEPPKRLGKRTDGSTKDVVTNDDAIIQGSTCAGLDCILNEDFGFDTLRLKENNTRLQFFDTSAVGFASNNWQIRANDSGGSPGNYLAFVDQGPDGFSESGNIVFSVSAGAPVNALTVSSTGNIGIGTATPMLDIHALTTDTPAIRLEQSNAGGFTAQTWDIGANEANFFVRDLTAGSRLPFRIRPGAPTSSLDISASGNVGVGGLPPATEPSSPALFVGGRFNIATSAAAGPQYVQISNNAKFDGATPRYVQNGPANQVYMNGDSTVFRRAGAGSANGTIPWVESMRIDAAGRVGVGGTPAAAEANSPYLFVGSRFSIGTSATAGPAYVQLSNNAIYNGVNPTYVGAGGASQMYMNGDTIVLRRAVAGSAGGVVAWAEGLRVDATGTRVTGDLHVTGTCCGPDYVFDPSFKLASIEENAAYMWKNRHLPAVGPTKVNSQGRTEVNVFAQTKGILEELEKAHIYIEQLHGEIKSLRSAAETRDSDLRRELAEIRARLAR